MTNPSNTSTSVTATDAEAPPGPMHCIAGLGRMTCDDGGFVRLQFVDEACAEAFMLDYGCSVEIDEMPEPAAPSVGEPVIVTERMAKELADAWCKKHSIGITLPALAELQDLIRLATPPAAPAATEAPSGVRVGRIEVINGRTVSWAFEQFDGVPDGEHAMYAIATPAPAVGASVPAFTAEEIDKTVREVYIGQGPRGLMMFCKQLMEGAVERETEAAVGASVQPVPASLSDEQIKREVEFAFASTNDIGNLSMYKYWFEKALRIGYELASSTPTSSAASEVKP